MSPNSKHAISWFFVYLNVSCTLRREFHLNYNDLTFYKFPQKNVTGVIRRCKKRTALWLKVRAKLNKFCQSNYYQNLTDWKSISNYFHSPSSCTAVQILKENWMNEMLITFDFVLITHVLWVAFGMLQRSLHDRVIHSVYCNRESQCSILVMSVFFIKSLWLRNNLWNTEGNVFSSENSWGSAERESTRNVRTAANKRY